MRLAATLAIGASMAWPTCHSQQPRSEVHPFDDLAALAPEASSQRGQVQPCVVVQGQDLGRCTPSVYYRMRGAAAFKRNQVEESCDAFDESMRLDPGSAGRLWQRGLSLFYAERLVDGMAQFANDVALNPNDTEETVRPHTPPAHPPASGRWCLVPAHRSGTFCATRGTGRRRSGQAAPWPLRRPSCCRWAASGGR